MEIDTINYPNLAKFQIREHQKAAQKRQDRELVERFGVINDDEEEQIWRVEQAMKVR